jgi:hypothetical protein
MVCSFCTLLCFCAKPCWWTILQVETIWQLINIGIKWVLWIENFPIHLRVLPKRMLLMKTKNISWVQGAVVDMWTCGHMDMWTYGHVDMWTCGHVDIWTCGHVDMWTCGHVDMWTYGHVNMWTCGHVDIWTCGHVDMWTKPTHRRLEAGEDKTRRSFVFYTLLQMLTK